MVDLKELMIILDLHRQGLSVTAIARQLGMDRKAVRKYIARGLEPPAYEPRPPRPRASDAFLGLAKICRKLGVSFWDYLGDRLAVPDGTTVAPLPDLIRKRVAPA